MSTPIKHPVLDRVMQSFVIFDIRALWCSVGQQTVLTSSRLYSNERLLLNSISLCFLRYWTLGLIGHDLDLSGPREVIGHVTIRLPIGHFLFDSSDGFSVRRTV